MWTSIREFKDIKYERTKDGIAKITINRPEVRNAFRPQTVSELKEAFDLARDDSDIGVVILTGEGPDAFCSGGDQRVRGKAGYVDAKGVPRLNILDVQKQIRSLPKPVIAMVAGYAIGGGHVHHVCVVGVVRSQTTCRTCPPPIAYPPSIWLAGCESVSARRGC